MKTAPSRSKPAAASRMMVRAGKALLNGTGSGSRSSRPQRRMITPLTRWRRYEPAYADGMRAVLKELLGHPGLSRDSFEVVSKSLA